MHVISGAIKENQNVSPFTWSSDKDIEDGIMAYIKKAADHIAVLKRDEGDKDGDGEEDNVEEQEDDENEEDGDELSDQEGFDNALNAGEINLSENGK